MSETKKTVNEKSMEKESVAADAAAQTKTEAVLAAKKPRCV